MGCYCQPAGSYGTLGLALAQSSLWEKMDAGKNILIKQDQSHKL